MQIAGMTGVPGSKQGSTGKLVGIWNVGGVLSSMTIWHVATTTVAHYSLKGTYNLAYTC